MIYRIRQQAIAKIDIYLKIFYLIVNENLGNIEDATTAFFFFAGAACALEKQHYSFFDCIKIKPIIKTVLG